MQRRAAALTKALRSGDDSENVAATLHELNDVHVIGTVFVFNTFLPLIHNGTAKKVIAITSGYSDMEPAREFGLDVAPFYSASKAAQNVIVAKYHAQYKDDGILFLAVAPGVVDVGQYNQSKSTSSFRTGRGLT